MPKAPFPSDRRRILIFVAFAGLGLVCPVAATTERNQADSHPGWSESSLAIVDDQSREDDFMEAAFSELTNRNIDGKFAAEAMSRLDRYVEAQLRDGKRETLCFGLIVDGVYEAAVARWSEADAGRLLIALQKEMDSNPRPPMAHFKQSIASIGQGKTVDQILGSSTERSKVTERR